MIFYLNETGDIFGKDLKDVQDENKTINKEMADVKLVNEKLTKKMAEIENKDKLVI